MSRYAKIEKPQICKEKSSVSDPDLHWFPLLFFYLLKHILDNEMPGNSVSNCCKSQKSSLNLNEGILNLYCKKRIKLMNMRICGSFQSAKNNWVRIANPHAKCHICGRSANLKKFESANLRFAELICEQPTFGSRTKISYRRYINFCKIRPEIFRETFSSKYTRKKVFTK